MIFFTPLGEFKNFAVSQKNLESKVKVTSSDLVTQKLIFEY